MLNYMEILWQENEVTKLKQQYFISGKLSFNYKLQKILKLWSMFDSFHF